MYRLIYRSIFLLLFVSCSEEKQVFEKIDFNSDYKFSSVIEQKVAKDSLPWKYQLSAIDYAASGNYKQALIHWDSAMPLREINYSASKIDSLRQNYTTKDAVDYIIEQAKEHQIVVINEAHHSSLHRFFTKSLLRKLFDNGYRNLGLETLSYGERLDSSLHRRKYPVLETGHYIKDPQFGNLVREALEVGYQLFPYENMSMGGGKPREIAQAKNIAEVIKANPGEKFLIYCGFEHVYEGPHRTWEKAMAGRLTEYTGIDPLTIDQVSYSEKSKPEYNHPLLKALDIEESSVIVDEANMPLGSKRGDGRTDLTIFHPNTNYTDDRPDWLFKNGNRKVSINLTDLDIEYPIMVLAYKKGEDIHKAVPVDIKEIQTNLDNCTLGLKKGDYEIVITNGTDSFKIDQEVK